MDESLWGNILGGEAAIWSEQTSEGDVLTKVSSCFLLILFGIYDDLTKDHVPGLQKYDICMTEQVPGSRRVKIVGQHMAMLPMSIEHKGTKCIYELLSSLLCILDGAKNCCLWRKAVAW